MKRQGMTSVVIFVATLLALSISAIPACDGGGGDDGGGGGGGGGGPLQGGWIVVTKWDSGDTDNHGIFNFEQNGKALTIKYPCVSNEKVGTGTVSGSQVSWDFDYHGSTWSWTGAWSGNTIVGPDVDDGESPPVNGVTYALKKSDNYLYPPENSYHVTGILDGESINYTAPQACGFEGSGPGDQLGYHISNRSYVLNWENMHPPTSLQTYQVFTSDQGAGSVIDVSFEALPNSGSVAGISGTITVTGYVARHSGSSSGIEGSFDITLAGGRGNLSGTFDSPFWAQFQDPYLGLP